MSIFPNVRTVEAVLDRGEHYKRWFKSHCIEMWLSSSGMYCGRVDNGSLLCGFELSELMGKVWERVR